MSVWTVAALGLVPALLVAIFAACRGPGAGRMPAVQIASTVGVLLAVTLTFVDDQASSIDLALALALLTLPASLLFALFEERWL